MKVVFHRIIMSRWHGCLARQVKNLHFHYLVMVAWALCFFRNLGWRLHTGNGGTRIPIFTLWIGSQLCIKLHTVVDLFYSKSMGSRRSLVCHWGETNDGWVGRRAIYKNKSRIPPYSSINCDYHFVITPIAILCRLWKTVCKQYRYIYWRSESIYLLSY